MKHYISFSLFIIGISFTHIHAMDNPKPLFLPSSLSLSSITSALPCTDTTQCKALKILLPMLNNHFNYYNAYLESSIDDFSLQRLIAEKELYEKFYHLNYLIIHL